MDTHHHHDAHHRHMAETLLGLKGVDVGEAVEEGGLVSTVVRLREQPVCADCGGEVRFEGEREVRLVDLPMFGRPTRLVWAKRRWRCPDSGCATGSFTEQAERIAPEGAILTSRAEQWATEQLDQGWMIAEVAEELGCDPHTIETELIR